MREIQILKKLQSEEQTDSGQESDISPSPQSDTSVSPKPEDKQQEDTTRLNSAIASSTSFPNDQARVKSILESVVISEKGNNNSQQKISRNAGQSKSILDKILNNRYGERKKRHCEPYEFNAYIQNFLLTKNCKKYK